MNDPRLFCNCGEIGTVKECGPDEGGGFRVFARRDGAPCCMGMAGVTPDDAIRMWAETQKDPLAFTEDVFEERDPAGWEGGFADNH